MSIKKKKRRTPRIKRQKNAFLRPSVAIKIFFLSATIFISFTTLYYLLKWTAVIELPDLIAGYQIKWFEMILQIVILSLAITVSTHIFLESPIKHLKKVIREVAKGRFNIRADIETSDEIGSLAHDFNNMLTQLMTFNEDKITAEMELFSAREELKYKKQLENRGKKIKETNRALTTLVQDFTLLYEIGQSVNSTIDISELYRVIQEALPERLNLERFAILLVDEKREFLNIKAAYGFDDNERIFDLSFRIGEGISGEAAKTGELIYVPDVTEEVRFLHYRGESSEKGSFVSVPLRYKKDVLGVMNCSRRGKNDFKEEDVRLLTMVANQIALAVENAQLYSKTRELSVRDELTGLYNRRHFQGVLQMEWKRTTRFRRPMSLLMIDIDHFKEFNDTFGHPFGDKVLKVLSNLILKNLREVDTVARFGGEEFVILLPDTGLEGAMVVAEKLRGLVEAERFAGEHQRIIPLTISIGVSSFPEDVREMDDLIDHADVALYEAKDNGRNRVIDYIRMSAAISDVTGGNLGSFE